MGTHFLEMAEGETCQDIEGNRPSERYSLPGDRSGTDLLGQGKKSTEQGTLTSWRQHKEGLVRTWKETDQSRDTHQLKMVEGGTRQGTERNRLSEGHSRTRDSRWRDLSGHRKKPTDRGYSQPGHGRERNLLGHGNKLTEGGSLTPWRR